MRAAIYARYSSDRQNERSIADQVAVCAAHAVRRGWTVVATFTDAAISGSTMANRPGLQSLLAAAETGAFDLVLVEDQDRLARNLEHEAHLFNRLRHTGVRIATLHTDEVKILDVAFKGLMNELYLVNLSEKTRRGMTSNAEKGLATGSRLFGYRSMPGGEMAIVPAEAEIIVDIFRLYADEDLSAREIADRLNRAGVRGPRGGWWNSSSIGGSRQRGNGVLNTELYAGVKVWNRMLVKKDPVTGKRTPIMKPETEWKRTPVPALRIVPEELWDRAHARRERDHRQRPTDLAKRHRPGLFSGLLKCARCGSSYTTHGPNRLICAGHRERGGAVCDNSRSVARDHVELRVLDGLRSRLLTPASVRAYVEAYRRAYEAQAAQDRADRAPLERRLAELERSINRIVDAVCDGTDTPAMKARLVDQEREKAEISAQLAELTEKIAGEDANRNLVALHPKAGEAYAAQIRKLHATLDLVAKGRDQSGDELSAAEVALDRRLLSDVRGLVDKIVIEPLGDRAGGPVKITLFGDLSGFLLPATGKPYTQSEWVTRGSWGRDRTADLWVMNPPL